MKVSIKDLSVDMEIKNNGVELDVYTPDGSKHLGDLIVTKTGLNWCKGRTERLKRIACETSQFTLSQLPLTIVLM